MEHDHIVPTQRVELVGPFLQPFTGLFVVTVPVVDRTDRAVDVIQDAILHDTRAAELGEARRRRAA
mgnify:CR=1 FL=1